MLQADTSHVFCEASAHQHGVANAHLTGCFDTSDTIVLAFLKYTILG